MAGNEIGCARISMMARSISSNTRPDTLVRDHRLQSHAFPLQRTAGPYIGVKRFQAIHGSGGNVARGLVLLYGLGARALPSWDPRTRWNNLLGGLSVKSYGRSKQTCELTSSIVPRGTLFHRLVELEFPPIALDPERPHAAAASLVHLNSVPSVQMRCIKPVQRLPFSSRGAGRSSSPRP